MSTRGRRTLLACLATALATLVACGGDDRPADRPSRSVAETASKALETGELPSEVTAPTGEFPGCPDGTEEARLEIAAVETEMRWCERPAEVGRGVRHGPWQKRQAGRLREAGSYREGLRHGRWTYYYSSGPRQSEGEFREDERAGEWIFWGQNSRELRRIDYGSGAVARVPDPTPVPEPVVETERVRLRIENTRSRDVVFVMEPWGQSYSMAPGAVAEVRLPAAQAADLQLESGDEAITLRAPEDTELTLGGDLEELP